MQPWHPLAIVSPSRAFIELYHRSRNKPHSVWQSQLEVFFLAFVPISISRGKPISKLTFKLCSKYFYWLCHMFHATWLASFFSFIVANRNHSSERCFLNGCQKHWMVALVTCPTGEPAVVRNCQNWRQASQSRKNVGKCLKTFCSWTKAVKLDVHFLKANHTRQEIRKWVGNSINFLWSFSLRAFKSSTQGNGTSSELT